jgi:hypothetical protein
VCCMALTPSEVYWCSAAELRQLCYEEGLDSEEPVRALRDRVVRHLKARAMKNKQES